jgi:hypothetical protein
VTDDDDLRINTLHRFAKHSPKLVLHEYSHCEVPAGCGGVVLRWIDPREGLPASFRVEAPAARGLLWLDGKLLTSSHGLLVPGHRAFALHMKRREPRAQPFWITIEFEPGPAVPVADAVCSPTAPSEGWTVPSFDDRGWQPAPRASAELIGAQERWTQSACQRAIEAGNAVFALEREELWLRFGALVPEPR